MKPYCSQTMKSSSLLILMLNTFCASTQIPHEIVYVVGCYENSTTEVQFEFDSEEILHVDFERQEVVYNVPPLFVVNPSEVFSDLHVYKNALKAKRTCAIALSFLKFEEKEIHPEEAKDPPESILYPAEEVQLGVENTLTCFVNHFYPPYIKVSWTKNDLPVSEGVSLGQYYPNDDQTFHTFSTLEFTPREGDIYSCTVEHLALERPQTRIWQPEFSHPSLGPDVFCGVGLTLGFLGVAVGTFLMVKGHHGHK
uniref:H-2 class II histocompatibility antigen, A-U alpha chain-like n=1 Tax=Semicossyphus pulcher TaxID=241346 RepID=UPI0037E95849